MSPGAISDHGAPTLPSPAEIRALNRLLNNVRGDSYRRPPPVRIPPLGLFVRYGADVTVTEAITQTWVRDQLRGLVTVPEVFGWTQDGGQTFIYMSLIEGKLNRQPLNDTILSYRPKLTGPFQGAEAVQQLQEACDIHIGADEQTVFTHNSLIAPNDRDRM
ncbi:hypothetical protein PLIIFM63780_003936 [Purpureocillium lilacinum]|nr:hypothetical protein PLIIFM63780_003936 [Purpureocillium lilacinum]